MLTIVVTEGADLEALLRPAVEALRAGGIVAFPTDTLYGLAVDPADAAAVERLYAAKGRDAAVAVPLVAADARQAEQTARLGSIDRRLAAAFWPGPLSIVAPATGAVSAALLGGGTTVAIRVPASDVARALARGLGAPVTATSANRSGQPPAADAAAVARAMGGAIDVLVDGGPAPGGAPSTIVEVIDGTPRCRRHGAIAWERVLEFLA